jgi:hypothetical protein
LGLSDAPGQQGGGANWDLEKGAGAGEGLQLMMMDDLTLAYQKKRIPFFD